jgi:hypothetical protein
MSNPAYLFAAPAARRLVALHIAEAGWYVDADPGHEGLTLCGLRMARAELWLPAEPRPGDRLCRDCAEAAHMALGEAVAGDPGPVQLPLWPGPPSPQEPATSGPGPDAPSIAPGR